MKIKFVSIKRLKIHEFNTTLRRMNKEEQTWLRKSAICSEIQEKAIKSFIGHLGQILIAYLIATSLRDANQISIKVSNFEASVPAAYFLFATSFLLLILSISFNHLSTAVSMKSALAGKMLLNGFSASTFDMLQNRSENALGIPTYMNSFVKEVLPISSVLGSLLLVAIVAMLVPILAFGYFLLAELYALALSHSISIPERVSAVAGVTITITAGLYVLFFHLPLPIKKNPFSIRWGFLYYLPPHPSDDEKFDRWLDKK